MPVYARHTGWRPTEEGDADDDASSTADTVDTPALEAGRHQAHDNGEDDDPQRYAYVLSSGLLAVNTTTLSAFVVAPAG